MWYNFRINKDCCFIAKESEGFVMNIGGINNMNYAAVMRLNTPSAAMRLNTPVANQASQYSMQQPVSNYPSVAPSALPVNHGNYIMFFSPDGDSVELSGRGMLEALEPQGICHTCENRRYVDQSDDASVSFQTPTKISPHMAGAAVAAHEQEHVRNEQANAHRDNREIVSQSVTLHYDTCPDCGKIYVSGGTTRTTSIGKSDSDDSFEPEDMSAGGESTGEDE